MNSPYLNTINVSYMNILLNYAKNINRNKQVRLFSILYNNKLKE